MRIHFFKWVLSLMGLFMRGPILIRLFYTFVGYYIGNIIDFFLSHLFFSQNSSYSTNHTNRSYQYASDTLLRATMTIFAHIIHADGRIMHSEMEYVRNFLRNQSDPNVLQLGEELILAIFKEKKSIPTQQWERMVSYNCQLLAMYMPAQQRIQFVQVLVQIAKVDGEISVSEYNAMVSIALYMGINTQIIDRIIAGNYSYNQTATHSMHNIEEDYALLGISPSATDDEVRKAYRKMAMKYHPDRMAKEDTSVRESAAVTFSKITEAKDRIYAKRGMK